jgi:hypothetical protein
MNRIVNRCRQWYADGSLWRKVMTLWIVVFSVVMIWYGADTRSNSASVKQLKNQNAKILGNQKRIERAQNDSCKNYIELRNAVNAFHSSFAGLLQTAATARAASYSRTHHLSDLRAVRAYNKLLNNLHTVHKQCAQRRKGK